MKSPHLEQPALSENTRGNAGVRALAVNLGGGSLQALDDLGFNQSGDPGCDSLPVAMAEGALPSIKAVELYGNPASEGARRAVEARTLVEAGPPGRRGTHHIVARLCQSPRQATGELVGGEGAVLNNDKRAKRKRYLKYGRRCFKVARKFCLVVTGISHIAKD